jgi:hypothetical protein
VSALLQDSPRVTSGRPGDPTILTADAALALLALAEAVHHHSNANGR